MGNIKKLAKITGSMEITLEPVIFAVTLLLNRHVVMKNKSTT